MTFKYSLPTKILFGERCIYENKDEIISFGKKAFIATGSKSGRLSGALNDITNIFDECGIEYYIFDEVENNPDLENVGLAGEKARAFGADFVIGVGGGSPIDAAKAIAVLATNEIEPIDLFSNKFKNKPLPILAVPTTAGTGSEVTHYSVLTRRDLETKRSFGNVDTFPKLAIMDPTYTMSLNRDVTVDTAIDAFSHGLEAYLSIRSTPMSDVFAKECIKGFAAALRALQDYNLDYETRSRLLYCSMHGGIAIAQTGTTMVHALGYSLTYFKNVPHGRANGLFLKEYLRFNYETCKEKIDHVLSIMGLDNIEEFGIAISRLIKNDFEYSTEELYKYSDFAMQQRSTSLNAREVKKDDLFSILKNSLS